MAFVLAGPSGVALSISERFGVATDLRSADRKTTLSGNL